MRGIYDTARKVASVYLGSGNLVDNAERDAEEVREGVIRLNGQNWEEEVNGWEGTWVIVMYVS